MAFDMTVNIPLRELLCDQCQHELKPVKQASDLDHFTKEVKVPGKGDDPPVMVPIEARQIDFVEEGPNRVRLRALIDLPCAGCGESHELWHQLAAAEIFVRELRKCSEGHAQELQNIRMRWLDNPISGPAVKLTGVLYCPTCESRVDHADQLAVNGSADLPEIKILELDMAERTLTASGDASG